MTPGDGPGGEEWAMTVDTREMVVIHRVFRRELGLLPRLIRGVADGDTARAARVTEHLVDVTTGLTTHHTGEDELLWPLLMQRVGLEATVVRRMEAQHEVVHERIGETQQWALRWAEHADVPSRDELATAVDQMHAALVEHLDDEERLMLPIIAENVSQQEWDALGEHGRASLPRGKKSLLFLGSILEDATDEERAEFLARLPLLARLMWRLAGERAYAREVQALRRDLVPA